MNGKNNSESLKGGRKTEDTHTSFKRVVSEGSTVILDVRDFVNDIDNINSIKHCLWKQTEGMPIVIDDVIDKPYFSFLAPYVEDNYLGNNTDTTNSTATTNTPIQPAYFKLGFQLTITDNDGKSKDSPYNVNIIVKNMASCMYRVGGK